MYTCVYLEYFSPNPMNAHACKIASLTFNLHAHLHPQAFSWKNCQQTIAHSLLFQPILTCNSIGRLKQHDKTHKKRLVLCCQLCHLHVFPSQDDPLGLSVRRSSVRPSNLTPHVLMHHQVYHHYRRRHHSVFSDNLAVGEDRCPLTSGPRHERTRARAICNRKQRTAHVQKPRRDRNQLWQKSFWCHDS